VSRRNWWPRLPKGPCWCVGCPRRAFEPHDFGSGYHGFVCDECLGRMEGYESCRPLLESALRLARPTPDPS
jgi:hypothetical protein